MIEVLLIISIFIFILLAFIAWKISTAKSNTDGSSFLMLQNQLSDLQKVVDKKLHDTSLMMSDSVREQFKASQALIRDITREIAEVKKTNEQVFSMTESLHSLEKVLKNQKQRGNLGEAGLELILENVLPPGSFRLQYCFPDGEICDAVIETKNGLIPIDAKFSLDNYMRAVEEDDVDRKSQYEKEFRNDLKKRIDETSKYIREKDGTLPFALMYIPAEGIYYDLLVGTVGASNSNMRDLIDYAQKDKKVIIVSPTTFVAYLHTILQGFRAFQIEERARDIEHNVEKLMRHLKSYEEYHVKLGNTLGTAVNHYNASGKELRKVDKDIFKITGASAEIEELVLDGPNKE